MFMIFDSPVQLFIIIIFTVQVLISVSVTDKFTLIYFFKAKKTAQPLSSWQKRRKQLSFWIFNPVKNNLKTEKSLTHKRTKSSTTAKTSSALESFPEC